jgi:hypothetical protein
MVLVKMSEAERLFYVVLKKAAAIAACRCGLIVGRGEAGCPCNILD